MSNVMQPSAGFFPDSHFASVVRSPLPRGWKLHLRFPADSWASDGPPGSKLYQILDDTERFFFVLAIEAIGLTQSLIAEPGLARLVVACSDYFLYPRTRSPFAQPRAIGRIVGLPDKCLWLAINGVRGSGFCTACKYNTVTRHPTVPTRCDQEIGGVSARPSSQTRRGSPRCRYSLIYE